MTTQSIFTFYSRDPRSHEVRNTPVRRGSTQNSKIRESIYANRREELLDVYSDMYKSVHGMRPRGRHLDDYTEEDLEEMIQQLVDGTGSGVRDDWNMSGQIPESAMKITRSRLRNIIAEEMGRSSHRNVRNSSTMPTLSSLLFEAEGDSESGTTPNAAGPDALSKLSVKSGPSNVVEFLNGPGADPRVRALLAAGKSDGDEADEAATITAAEPTIGGLIPTQIEIELTKSIGYPLAKFDVLKKMISGGVQKIGPKGNDMIVKSGDLIVDGHHRWSSLFSVAGPSGQIAAIDVSLPEKDAASVLAIVQTAIASTLKGPVPKAKAGGMNILGKSEDQIASLITKAYESGEGEAGPILTNKFVSMCMADPSVNEHFGLQKANIVGPRRPRKEKSEGESDQKAESRSFQGMSLLEKRGSFSGKYGERDRIARARRHIIKFVANNLSQMKQPAEGSPPRVDMPQLDKAGGGVTGALEKLKAGDVNYKPPYAAESHRRGNNDQIVLERWQKLAGLIKG